MDTVAGFSHHPGLQLAVRVCQSAELAQGQKAALDIFDAGLDDALLLRIAWRAGIDLEAIAFGALGIGPLHLRLIETGLGDGAFGVVDDDARRHAGEGFECAPVASQPGRHRLIAHELRILMARPGQRHHEEPGLEDFAGMHIGHQRAGAEIDLDRFCRLELQAQRHFRNLQCIELEKETVDRRIAAGVTMIAGECCVNRGALDASCTPLGDLLAPRLQR